MEYHDVARHLGYDPQTGVVYWRKPLSRKHKPGDSAGWVSHGYRRVTFKGARLAEHRVAWLLFYGCWPLHEIDHINQNKLDNRISNLRDVPKALNQKNTRLPTNNTSGVQGVCWIERDAAWSAVINDNGKTIYLGYFKDFFDACCARKAAEPKYGYHINHGRN